MASKVGGLGPEGITFDCGAAGACAQAIPLSLGEYGPGVGLVNNQDPSGRLLCFPKKHWNRLITSAQEGLLDGIWTQPGKVIVPLDERGGVDLKFTITEGEDDPTIRNVSMSWADTEKSGPGGDASVHSVQFNATETEALIIGLRKGGSELLFRPHVGEIAGVQIAVLAMRQTAALESPQQAA